MIGLFAAELDPEAIKCNWKYGVFINFFEEDFESPFLLLEVDTSMDTAFLCIVLDFF